MLLNLAKGNVAQMLAEGVSGNPNKILSQGLLIHWKTQNQHEHINLDHYSGESVASRIF